jgi:glycosyltransferase involved in cell wall biosynthesis
MGASTKTLARVPAVAPTKPLRIAWLGLVPLETGGAPGAATELLHGLGALGHRIDCFLPGDGRKLPARLSADENLTFIWRTSGWHWNRWYSRRKTAAFVTGLIARGLVSLRLRREVTRRHRQEPYDVLLQASSIESLSVPARLTGSVPLVILPQSHAAGELKCLIAERRLSMHCQPAYIFALVGAMMFIRALVQSIAIRRASLLICVSSVFRDHMVRDYRFPVENTVVVTNPVRLERFANTERQVGKPPCVLVPTRISVRKGIEDVVAVARILCDRNADVRIRVVGGPSLWSDYTRLLENLPAANAEYVGRVPPSEMPAEFARSDVMLIASKYDPCPLAVTEALAAGVPVVATSEVGSIEGIDRAVVTEVQPGDVEGMATGIIAMLERLEASHAETRSVARAEAERRFAPDVVADQVSRALERLVEGLSPGHVSPG